MKGKRIDIYIIADFQGWRCQLGAESLAKCVQKALCSIQAKQITDNTHTHTQSTMRFPWLLPVTDTPYKKENGKLNKETSTY